jgi:predicted nucleic acid-binding Zn ribbon protein
MPEKAFKDMHTIIKTVLDNHGLTDKIQSEKILLNWSLIVGDKISKMCQPVSFKNGELTIRTKDNFWREELAHRQHDLLNLLDIRIEKSLVKKIYII